jgi:hypothetical protein
MKNVVIVGHGSWASPILANPLLQLQPLKTERPVDSHLDLVPQI